MTNGRILVLGATGQLGAQVVRAFGDRHVIAPPRAELDITNTIAVVDFIERTRPQVIVNCAAFNDVDAAEDRPLDALAANALAVRALARGAEASDATLVHYSTDFVFDGTAAEPYAEDAAPAPRGTYAASKLLGEWFAIDAPRAFVLRVESLFGSPRGWRGRRGTFDGILARIEHGEEVRAFTDRTVSPSYIVDVAAATRYLVDHAPAGTYHCVNSGHATWYDLAREVARQLGVDARVQPITLDDVALKAARPRFCALSNRKLQTAGFVMPTWQDALRRWLTSRAPAPQGVNI